MNTDQFWGNTPCIKTRSQFILQPEPQEIVELNQQLFHSHTKHWFKKYKFYSVIRYCENNILYIKLYYSDRLIEDNRQIEDYVNAFYSNFIKNLEFSRINFLGIPYPRKFQVDKTKECNYYKEFELILLSSLNSSSWVSCNSDGKGCVGDYCRWTLKNYHYWTNLLDEGYLEHDYVDRLEKEKLPKPSSSAIRTINDVSNPNNGSYSLNAPNEEVSYINLLKKVYYRNFVQNGTKQPSTDDPYEINYYFYERFSKVWSISHGFCPTFIEYTNETIVFELLLDQRVEGDSFQLSRLLAKEYKKKIDQFKNAVSFEARVYLVKDNIGFLYNPTLSDIQFVYSYSKVERAIMEPIIISKLQNYGKIEEPKF